MKDIPLDINAKNFIDSYRNIGYSIQTAIADVVDNSITAKASEIRINMLWEDFENGKPVVQILDNGEGMTNAELIEAMRLACKSPLEKRDVSDLGRFGLGLKSASFSQCRVLSVVSKKQGYEACCKQWDIDYIKDKEAFVLKDCSVDEVGLITVVPKNSGTSVVWSNLDQLNIPNEISIKQKQIFWRRIMLNVRNHISITYGSFKDKVDFFFNDNLIELWDPFLQNHKGTKLITDEYIVLNNHKIEIKTYILPNKLEADELSKATLGKSLCELQGFYLYRSNRLIKYGGWFDLPKMENREAYRLARIRIDIDNSMDTEWQIDIKKENAICPPSIVDRFITYARNARTASSKIFRSKGKTLRRSINNLTSPFLWTYGTRDSKPFYAINRDNPIIKALNRSLDEEQQKIFTLLLKSLENYIPVQSILEIESDSNGTYVENSASHISDDEIEILFMEMVKNMIENDNCDFYTATQFLRENEPFINHLEVVDAIIEKESKSNAR